MLRNEINEKCYIGSGTFKLPIDNGIHHRFRNHFYHSVDSSSVVIKRTLKLYGSDKIFYDHLKRVVGKDKPIRKLKILLEYIL